MVIRGKETFDIWMAPSNHQLPRILFSTCDIHNYMVMSGRIHSIEDNITKIYLLYPTPKAVWDSITLVYFGLADSSQMFDL